MALPESFISTSQAIYLASVLGAIAVAWLLPRQPAHRGWPLMGVILGCATLGGLWVWLGQTHALLGNDMDLNAFRYHYVFGAIAVISAVRVITHTRPVYAALWFILVVLACAGLFLTLSAEFVATAAVIIYGGAILVTYMFVIMLASPPQDNSKKVDDAIDTQGYDLAAREPWWACATGFLLLAVLLTAAFDKTLPAANPNAATSPATAQTILAMKPADIGNTQQVGLDLFQNHPFAIELAGALLLVSLVGAVVIAKMRVHNEDEVSAH